MISSALGIDFGGVSTQTSSSIEEINESMPAEKLSPEAFADLRKELGLPSI